MQLVRKKGKEKMEKNTRIDRTGLTKTEGDGGASPCI